MAISADLCHPDSINDCKKADLTNSEKMPFRLEKQVHPLLDNLTIAFLSFEFLSIIRLYNCSASLNLLDSNNAVSIFL